MSLAEAIRSILPLVSQELWKTSSEIESDLSHLEIDHSERFLVEEGVGMKRYNTYPVLCDLVNEGKVRCQPTSPAVFAEKRSIYEYQRLS